MPPPNILVTGTPSTGKSTTCNMIAAACDYNYLDTGKLVKEHVYHKGWDDEYQCLVLDEDKLLDAMEPIMARGGNVVEYHGCELFPERWFQLVVVLRTNNSVLYDRLVSKGYNKKKIDDNMQCEIMQVILEEAFENYDPSIVWERESNSKEDLEKNVEAVLDWIRTQESKPEPR